MNEWRVINQTAFENYGDTAIVKYKKYESITFIADNQHYWLILNGNNNNKCDRFMILSKRD